MDERERIFQDAVERIDLASVPTLGGWTRKVAEVEEHQGKPFCRCKRCGAGKHTRENAACNCGGKFVEVEGLMVQSARKTDYRMEQSIDLLSCLPNKR